MASIRDSSLGPFSRLREQFRLPPVPIPFGATLLASLALFIGIAWPVRVPMFLGIVAAITTRHMFERLNRWLGYRRAASAGIMTLLLLAAVVLPSIGMITVFMGQAREVAGWAMTKLQMDGAEPSFQNGVDHLAAGLANTLHVDLHAVQSALHRTIERVYNGFTELALLPLALTGNIIVLCITHFFMAADGHHIANYLSRVAPFRPEQTHELLDEFHKVTSGAVWSCVCNGLGQGLIMGAGFYFARVPHPLLLGIVSCFAALIPLFGSGLVWGPCVAYLCLNGHGTAGALLSVWCFVMVAVVDNTVKPWVLRGRVEFHGGLLLLGFVGGVGLFGATGLVAGPLAVAFFLTMLRIYQRDYLDQQVVGATSSGAVVNPHT